MGGDRAEFPNDTDAHPYTICDATGRAIAVHVRLETSEGKRFRWALPDGTSGLGGLHVADLPLYGIDRLSASSTVVLVEGEKAAEALWMIGVQAVSTVTGASATPSKAVLDELASRRVLLWPDNDVVGRSHMRRIAELLIGIAASIGMVDWTDAPLAGDAADYVALGHTAEDVAMLPIRSAHLDGEWAERIPTVLASPETRSAQTLTQGRAQPDLPFRSARQYAAETSAVVEWVAGPYVAAGAITAVEGKIKSAGKTTFVTHLCRAVLDGSPFLGEPTCKTGVVYLTEQPGSSFREALRRAELLDRDDLVLLPWADASAIKWSDLVAGTADECHRRGARLLVVDTLGRFAGIRGDGENSAGEAEAVMAPLQVAAASGLAIILVRHERKSGGDVGDAGRGSSAFGGAVDIILALRRLEGAGPANRRALHALSRFDETPEFVVVELTESGYVALGDETALAQAEACSAILDLLAGAGPVGRSMEQLVTPSRPRTTVQRVLDDLREADTVVRLGRGVKGDPFRFALAELIAGPGSLPDAWMERGETGQGVESLARLFRNLGADIDAFGERS